MTAADGNLMTGAIAALTFANLKQITIRLIGHRKKHSALRSFFAIAWLLLLLL